jgi:predicted enzyme related to lactoylglutathione lyase
MWTASPTARVPHRQPSYGAAMTLTWEQTVIDAHDPRALAQWWARALGWVITIEDEGEVEIRRAPDVEPGLLFLPVADTKIVKNRLHIDLRPDDQDAEVARLVALGARPIDIGQGDASWVVLADPEGNEFCVLSSRPTA